VTDAERDLLQQANPWTEVAALRACKRLKIDRT
jgi:hypothetical protein